MSHLKISKHVIPTALLLLLTGGVSDAVLIANISDSFTQNDPSRGPDSVQNRDDFVLVRDYADSSTNRKAIGYFKFDISGVDPANYGTATIGGSFQSTGHDSAGTWNVYGLLDGVLNTDDVADGSFSEENWSETALSYDKGLGVDTSVLPETPNDLGIDGAETILLGTMTISGNDEPFSSNTTDLDLGSFLASDTNDFVTFMITDAAQAGTEWRILARESDASNAVSLSVVPEPTSATLAGLGALALVARRRRPIS